MKQWLNDVSSREVPSELTDKFNFDFNTKTKKINVISFNDNKLIKDKISSYGRFFKVTL